MEKTGIKFLNLNALQTYISAALYAIPVLLLNLGCKTVVEGATETLDCSTSTLVNPVIAVWLGTFLAAAKFVIIPAIQPGGWFRNLFETKVPVVPATEAAAPGTVTAAQVKK